MRAFGVFGGATPAAAILAVDAVAKAAVVEMGASVVAGRLSQGATPACLLGLEAVVFTTSSGSTIFLYSTPVVG